MKKHTNFWAEIKSNLDLEDSGFMWLTLAFVAVGLACFFFGLIVA